MLFITELMGILFLMLGLLAIYQLVGRLRICMLASRLWLDADAEATDWSESGHYLKVLGS